MGICGLIIVSSSKYFGLSGTKAHNALNDARDTASIIRELDVDSFIQEEREWRKECESMYVA